MVWTKMLLKTALTSVLAGGFLLLGGSTIARADDFDSCRRNVDKWEDKLERDTQRYGRYGRYSRQANHDRHELGEARESCERRYGQGWRDRSDYDRDGDRR